MSVCEIPELKRCLLKCPCLIVEKDKLVDLGRFTLTHIACTARCPRCVVDKLHDSWKPNDVNEHRFNICVPNH